ncbi:DUF397 domain-containing protein [Streptomyces sp. NPDC001480]
MTLQTFHVRDSKNKHGAQLALKGAPWAEFVTFAGRSA